MAAGQLPRVELPGLSAAGQWVVPQRVQILPTIDPGTHTVQLRADLPAGQSGVTPGMFARLWLPVPVSGATAPNAPLSVSSASIVRRAELTGLYVLDPHNKPVLRQVRLGRVDGDKVEVLSGLMPGERVVADPQAAARAR
jgi:multidrug efflux pump subunit AcrA (membrane-fusion protein)